MCVCARTFGRLTGEGGGRRKKRGERERERQTKSGTKNAGKSAKDRAIPCHLHHYWHRVPSIHPVPSQSGLGWMDGWMDRTAS